MWEKECNPSPGRDAGIQRLNINQEEWVGQAVKYHDLAKRGQMTQRNTPCRREDDAVRNRDK